MKQNTNNKLNKFGFSEDDRAVLSESIECNSCHLNVRFDAILLYNHQKQGLDKEHSESDYFCPMCGSASLYDPAVNGVKNLTFTRCKGGSSHSGVPDHESEGAEVRSLLKNKLVENQYYSAAGSIDACGNVMIELKCNDCDEVKEVPHHCDNRVCDKCGSTRWSSTVRDLNSRIFDRMDWNDVRFMTLTVGNTENLERQDVKDIRESFKKLKRRDYFDKRINGGVYSIECNYNGSWNLHMHVVYQGGYIHQDKLSSAWKDLTGFPIVDIRKSRTKNSEAQELAKYITKQPDVSSDGSDDSAEDKAERLLEYHEAMYKTNLVQPFGIFHHSSDKAVSLRWSEYDYCCPECGSSDVTASCPPMREIAKTIKPVDPPDVSAVG